MPYRKVDKRDFASTVAIAILNKPDITLGELASITGMSQGGVNYRMKELGIRRKTGYIIPPDLLEKARV